ncbi:MAG: PAS domain-containing protein [Kordiimonadaceae bacterium]|nr:PAS domain-containing protein [Kordiimonadaceae bacterium]
MNFIGKEVFFDRDDLIVSKTDPTGRIIYANHTFLEVADYTEEEVIGKQHNIIRCPAMPRAIFERFWNTLKAGEEIFAYVVNSTKNGDHYWVIAHVTPSVVNGTIVGFHSTRRVPSTHNIRNVIMPLYDDLKRIEDSTASKRVGLEKSLEALDDKLTEMGVTYAEFVAALAKDD